MIYQRWINKKNNQQALYRQALQYADEKQNVMQQRIEENESAFALLQDRENQNLDEIAQRAIDNSIEERKVGTSYMVISADFYIQKGDVIV